MKALLGHLFLALLVVLNLALAWRLIETHFLSADPEYVAVALAAPVATPFWSPADSLDLAMSRQALETEVTAQAYLVFDVDSQTILLAKNTQQPLLPASTTKIMTALAALELYDLNEIVEVSTQAAAEHDGGGLFPHERLTVRDLLIGLLVSSANDSAYALAEHASGGVPEFVATMNRLAQELRLEHAVFANPAGYDEPPNAITARDLVLLTLRAAAEPGLLEWMSSSHSVVYNQEGTIQHYLFTTNELLGREPGIIAGKTGTTPLAKEVLVSLAEHDGRTFVIAVLESDDRYADTRLLLRWVTENIQWQLPE